MMLRDVCEDTFSNASIGVADKEREEGSMEIYAVFEEYQEEQFRLSDAEFFFNKKKAMMEFNRRKNRMLEDEEWEPSYEFDLSDTTDSNNSVLFERDGSEMYLNIETIQVNY